MSISIIIVNYNLSREVELCIDSILNVGLNSIREIIVIDNNSTEHDSGLLFSKYSSLKEKIYFHYLKENNGFGSGNNYGSFYAMGDLIFFLNPDTLIDNNIFPFVENIFQNNPSISVLGPKVINENHSQEKSAGKFPNLLLEFFNIFSLSIWIEKRYFNFKSKNVGEGFIDVDWITGAALFVRKFEFERIGGFDTNYFMYSEEIDLCKRIKNNGGRVVYYPKVEIVHKGSIGSKKNYYFFTKTSYESKIYYTKKHFTGTKKLLILIFMKVHIAFQILIWLLLLPINSEKSVGKLKAFLKLL
jgi:GT2 family glycosyltransferase